MPNQTHSLHEAQRYIELCRAGSRFRGYNPETEIKIRVAKAGGNPINVERLLQSWKTFRELPEDELILGYLVAERHLRGTEFALSDVADFCASFRWPANLTDSIRTHGRFGYFISAAVNLAQGNETSLYIGEYPRVSANLMENISYQNSKNISIVSDMGLSALFNFMSGGTASVIFNSVPSSAITVGSHMKGGTITVPGGLKHKDIGYGMSGGTIVIDGDASAISVCRSMHRGKVIINGDLTHLVEQYPSPVPPVLCDYMYGGELHVNGRIDGFSLPQKDGYPYNNGRIYQRGRLIIKGHIRVGELDQ